MGLGHGEHLSAVAPRHHTSDHFIGRQSRSRALGRCRIAKKRVGGVEIALTVSKSGGRRATAGCVTGSRREHRGTEGEVGSSAAPDWYAARVILDGSEDEPWVVPRRLVLVAVGVVDQRAVKAVEQAWRIPAGERRALHVVTDDSVANVLAREWMRRDLSFPLRFVENEGGVGATIAQVVRVELAGDFDDVVVLAGRLVLRRRLHRLLHDRTADRISRALARVPSVQVGVVNVATT